MVQPGDPAKNFSLKDQNDKTFDLYEQTGRRILLSFHPLAWTEYCAAQMKSFEDKREMLASLNCIPVGISVDSVPCKRGMGLEPCHYPYTTPVRFLAAGKSGSAVRDLPGPEGIFLSGLM
jgi:hypothetical protein